MVIVNQLTSQILKSHLETSFGNYFDWRERNGDAIYDSFHRDYPRIGKTESACYFVRLKENPLHKINYDTLLIEKMEI